MTHFRHALSHCNQAMVMCQLAMVVAGLQRSLQVSNDVNAAGNGSLQADNCPLQACYDIKQVHNEQLQVNYDHNTTAVTSLQANNDPGSTSNAIFSLLFLHASHTIWH